MVTKGGPPVPPQTHTSALEDQDPHTLTNNEIADMNIPNY